MEPTEHISRAAEEMAEITFSLLEHCQLKQERIAASLGVSVPEFRLLRCMTEGQARQAGELAVRLHVSASRLTRIIEGLEQKRFVRREISQIDRRVILVVLTEKGSEILGHLRQTFKKTHEDIVLMLPPESVDSVIFALGKLREAMDRWASD